MYTFLFYLFFILLLLSLLLLFYYYYFFLFFFFVLTLHAIYIAVETVILHVNFSNLAEKLLVLANHISEISQPVV